MIYKALMSDIDGTLVANQIDALPSDNVRDAVTRAMASVTVCLVTGRSLQHSEDIMRCLNITGPCIFSNGAMIFDPVRRKILREHLLSAEDIGFISPVLRRIGSPGYVRNKSGRYELTEAYRPQASQYVYIPPLTEAAFAELEAAIRQKDDLALHIMIAWEKGDKDYMITKSTATKQHAILEAAEILGISTKEIIGVGDGYNDFPLLMACGLKVAMGNAVADLKAIADYIAPSVDRDGVADVINKYILMQAKNK